MKQSIITMEIMNNALECIARDFPDANNNGLTKSARATKSSPLDDKNDKEILRQVQTAFEWTEQAVYFCGVYRTFSKTATSSYGLKHTIEWWGKANGLEPYVCNMAAIVAFYIHPKVKIKLIGNSCNPITNIKTSRIGNPANEYTKDSLMRCGNSYFNYF
ncbi:hypothetical protein [Photobacterium indicum]|uniref:Uncharacterized protein n=1 Tax=Photobacterium indicum TaxID=81447 RepID=A0A2T3L3C4_9GAMM|nr:hypothetical protein [Photobacterium indicum]PSV43603.1 hypothetical protein C9J47_22305 [Photobacterium indicum]